MTDRAAPGGRLVLADREGPVAIVSLNRPERHNSLVPELLEELIAVLRAEAADPGVAAIVLTAQGPSFSTGGDVRAFYDQDHNVAEYAGRIVGLLNEAILTMIDLPCPIVAAVHGIVTGGSLGLVLGADLVLVADEAAFTPWYTTVGFAPDGGWTAMLPAVIGGPRAADLLLRDVTMTAEDAVAWGLAAAVLPAAGLRKAAIAIATEIAIKVPGAVRAVKAGLRDDRERIATGLEAERRRFVAQITTVEARAGMARFLGGSAR